jgi:hypothetical protein
LNTSGNKAKDTEPLATRVGFILTGTYGPSSIVAICLPVFFNCTLVPEALPKVKETRGENGELLTTIFQILKYLTVSVTFRSLVGIFTYTFNFSK